MWASGLLDMGIWASRCGHLGISMGAFPIFRPFGSIVLGFDTNHDSLTTDFKNSQEIKLSNGKVLLALDDEELDEKGNFKPAPERKIILDNLPLEIAANKPEILLENFKDYFTFFNSNIRCLPDGNIYDGRVVIKVKEFKKIPNRRFSLKIDNTHTIEISVRCFGHDKNDEKKRKKETKDDYDD